MEFRVLGPLEVVDGGNPIRLGGARQRALLAFLVTRADEVVSVDRLIDELWGAAPPANAANALQYHVSQLRKTLSRADVIETHEPGYVLRLGGHELDLRRFEGLVAQSQDAAPPAAARLLREALALWRGAALADVTSESFAEAEARRLEELRLNALELRCEADLALGRHAELVPELEGLVRDHPLREPFRGQLMRALYATGRQAEALTVYRDGRALLVEELGIEPSPTLRDLEQAILRQDRALATPEHGAAATPPARQRAILVVGEDDERLRDGLSVAEPLARQRARDLVVARFLPDGGDLAAASATLAELRQGLEHRGVASRVAAYTTDEPGREAELLAAQHDVDLLVTAAPRLLAADEVGPDLAHVLAHAACDVAVLAGGDDARPGPVVTPFGGVEHDWSAIELAGWLAQALGTSLRLVGTEADASRGRRDASRLLARASMLVQQVIGIVAEPVLVPAGDEGMRDAARGARLLVVGLSERWRSEGIGAARLAVAAGTGVPTLFVRRGLRPGGVAPEETMTRFTWTLGAHPARR